MSLLLQLLANGLVNAAIYSLLAVGFGLVYRTMAVFHIAYGGIYVIAPYLLYTLYVLFGMPLIVSLPLALIMVMIAGYLNERVVYRPFFNKSASPGVVLIASLGLYIAIENLIALIYGNEVKILSKGIEPSFSMGPVILTRIQMVQFGAGLLVLIVFMIASSRMRIFKLIWAMGDEPDLIRIMGLPLYRLREFVLVLSSLFAGLAACLTALDIGVDPHVGMSALLTAAVAVLVGGIDSYRGWILGGLVLAELQSLAVWKFSARWIELVTFGLLILILLTRPQGLLGTRKRIEEAY